MPLGETSRQRKDTDLGARRETLVGYPVNERWKRSGSLTYLETGVTMTDSVYSQDTGPESW